MKILLLPPLGLVLVLAALAMVGAGWRRRLLAVAVTCLICALHLPLVADGLARIPGVLTPDFIEKTPEAIIVPSAGFQDGEPVRSIDALTLERLAKAAELARATGLPVLVSGGQDGTEGPSLADLMAQRLIFQFEVPEPWIEGRSLNTAQNAEFSARMLKLRGIEAAYLVTQDWHMARARTAFAAQGLSTTPAAILTGSISAPLAARLTPSISAAGRSAWAIHEIVGLLWYRLTLPGV
ncbi:YdcF family protein [Lacibacterium aquatile]|uniref:YdcF family protein n=1 Tax=Lacibacterium aquatile TaxID=1168082 RepID=A0ABW5E1S3_9PROT